jgi:hypothetical protein
MIGVFRVNLCFQASTLLPFLISSHTSLLGLMLYWLSIRWSQSLSSITFTLFEDMILLWWKAVVRSSVVKNLRACSRSNQIGPRKIRSAFCTASVMFHAGHAIPAAISHFGRHCTPPQVRKSPRYFKNKSHYDLGYLFCKLHTKLLGRRGGGVTLPPFQVSWEGMRTWWSSNRTRKGCRHSSREISNNARFHSAICFDVNKYLCLPRK